jgi:asparagine synthase (glutamine-hydrolysing)
MYAGMKHCPHEKCGFAIQDNCGFGHLLVYNTPEAVNENMPRWLEEDKLLFVAEGRIDNRENLFGALNIPAGEQVTIPDGDLILKAYQKWGQKCPEKLLGKWSLAAFYTGEQRLFLARDQWDYTVIDYYMDDKVFAFASSTMGLLPLPFIKKDIDEFRLARLLTTCPGDPDKADGTWYKGIRSLPPAHTLHVTREHSTLHRYWDCRDIPVRRGLKLEEYTEELLYHLNKSVAARLRSYKPVAATLSGGLDSSTVCVLAAEQLATQGKRLRTFSHIPQFSPSGTLLKYNFGNEKPFIDVIVEACPNIDPAFLTSGKISPIEGIREALQWCGQPFHGSGNAYWMVDIFRTALLENYGTLLLGEFGNCTISWTGTDYALCSGEALRRYGISGFIKKKVLKPLLYRNLFLASIYESMGFGGQPCRKYTYCTASFEKSLHIAEKIKALGFAPAFKKYFKDPKELVYRNFGKNSSRLRNGACAGYKTGLELRDPTGDIRVIESVLAIPNEAFFGDMDKWILRTMMKGRLPDKVRLNTRKGMQSADLAARVNAHQEEMNRMLAEMESSGFGRIVDMGKMKNEWETLQADCHNYPQHKIDSALRAVAGYMMWKDVKK